MGHPNQALYCISAGTVGVRKLDDDGNSVLLHLAYPGDTLGYRSFLAGSEHQTTAEALGPCFICMIGSDTVSDLLARNPDLGLQFLKRANTELERAYDTIVKNATLSNRARLAYLLLIMLQRHGETAGNRARRLRIPMSRRDLASMIGVRNETLSRIIRRLEDDGVASFSGRCVDIPKIEALISEIPSSICERRNLSTAALLARPSRAERRRGEAMPIHDFLCHGCGELFEALMQSSADEDRNDCPACGSDTVSRR